MRRLLVAREPTFARADLTIQSWETPHETIVATMIEAIAAHLADTPPSQEPPE